MAKKILINCNHGREDAERVTLPFVVANVSATADQETIVFLTIEGVRLGIVDRWLAVRRYILDLADEARGLIGVL